MPSSDYKLLICSLTEALLINRLPQFKVFVLTRTAMALSIKVVCWLSGVTSVRDRNCVFKAASKIETAELCLSVQH